VSHIKRLFGEDAELFSDLLAATSPRNQVKRNWRQAKRVLKIWKKTGDADKATAFLMKTLVPNVKRALNRERLHGEKVNRFAKNLKGDYECVTIDIWMCRAYGIESKRLDTKLYKKLESKIKREAEKLGIQPASYQAIIWCKIRECSGLGFRSFMGLINDEAQGVFWDNMN